jgi:hypothetical protein
MDEVETLERNLLELEAEYYKNQQWKVIVYNKSFQSSWLDPDN